MCMFSGSVSSVSQTKIFVAPLTVSGKQITVYSKKVTLGAKTDKHVAMVLPFPTKDGSCQVVDLSKYKTIFSDLDKLFPAPKSFVRSSTDSFGGSRSLPMLAVERSGSYQYTVVPSWNDLDRVQSNVFNVDLAAIKTMTQQHYLYGFGFLVCIIDQSAEYYPIAYIHDMLPEQCLFVPTRHQHGKSKETSSDWSHAIYSLGTVSNHCGASATVYNQNHQPSSFPIALEKILQLNLLGSVADKLPNLINPKYIRKLEIEGRKKNQDYVFATYQTLMKSPSCTFFFTSNQHHVVQPWFMDYNNAAFSRGNGICLQCTAEYKKQVPQCDLTFADHSEFFCDRGLLVMNQWDALLNQTQQQKLTWASLPQWVNGEQQQQQHLPMGAFLNHCLKKQKPMQVMVASPEQAIHWIMYLLLLNGNEVDYSIPQLAYGPLQFVVQQQSLQAPTSAAPLAIQFL